MKHEGKHLYVYLGRNGFLLNIEFCYKNKVYNTEISLFWCRFDEID